MGLEQYGRQRQQQHHRCTSLIATSFTRLLFCWQIKINLFRCRRRRLIRGNIFKLTLRSVLFAFGSIHWENSAWCHLTSKTRTINAPDRGEECSARPPPSTLTLPRSQEVSSLSLFTSFLPLGWKWVVVCVCVSVQDPWQKFSFPSP